MIIIECMNGIVKYQVTCPHVFSCNHFLFMFIVNGKSFSTSPVTVIASPFEYETHRTRDDGTIERIKTIVDVKSTIFPSIDPNEPKKTIELSKLAPVMNSAMKFESPGRASITPTTEQIDILKSVVDSILRCKGANNHPIVSTGEHLPHKYIGEHPIFNGLSPPLFPNSSSTHQSPLHTPPCKYFNISDEYSNFGKKSGSKLIYLAPNTGIDLPNQLHTYHETQSPTRSDQGRILPSELHISHQVRSPKTNNTHYVHSFDESLKHNKDRDDSYSTISYNGTNDNNNNRSIRIGSPRYSVRGNNTSLKNQSSHQIHSLTALQPNFSSTSKLEKGILKTKPNITRNRGDFSSPALPKSANQTVQHKLELSNRTNNEINFDYYNIQPKSPQKRQNNLLFSSIDHSEEAGDVFFSSQQEKHSNTINAINNKPPNIEQLNGAGRHERRRSTTPLSHSSLLSSRPAFKTGISPPSRYFKNVGPLSKIDVNRKTGNAMHARYLIKSKHTTTGTSLHTTSSISDNIHERKNTTINSNISNEKCNSFYSQNKTPSKHINNLSKECKHGQFLLPEPHCEEILSALDTMKNLLFDACSKLEAISPETQRGEDQRKNAVSAVKRAASLSLFIQDGQNKQGGIRWLVSQLQNLLDRSEKLKEERDYLKIALKLQQQ